MSRFVESILLPSGDKMPLVGLGTWGLNEELETILDTALEMGYRHIDTAYLHGNEEVIGRVLRQWLEGKRLKRRDLFVTSKLPPTGISPAKVRHFCELSLEMLSLSYIDLYLIHLPVGLNYTNDEDLFPTNVDGTIATDCGTDLAATWNAMEKLVEEGLVRNIGLSNFNEEQIEKLLESAVTKPANLQIELNAYFQQKDLRMMCREMGITVTGSCPLGSPNRESFLFAKPNCKVQHLFEDATIRCIAEKCERSPAQILLRHAVQKRICVIPLSTSVSHLLENLDIFNFYLTPSEMQELDALDKGQFERSFDYSFLGESFLNHAEFPFAPKVDESAAPHH